MSDCVGTRTKDKDEARTYSIDWSPQLIGGETIASASWTVQSGLTNAATSNTTTSTSIRLTGGTVGLTYKVECQITGSQNNTPSAYFIVAVTN